MSVKEYFIKIMNRLDYLIDYLVKEDNLYSELEIPETEQKNATFSVPCATFVSQSL